MKLEKKIRLTGRVGLAVFSVSLAGILVVAFYVTWGINEHYFGPEALPLFPFGDLLLCLVPVYLLLVAATGRWGVFR